MGSGWLVPIRLIMARGIVPKYCSMSILFFNWDLGRIRVSVTIKEGQGLEVCVGVGVQGALEILRFDLGPNFTRSRPMLWRRQKGLTAPKSTNNPDLDPASRPCFQLRAVRVTEETARPYPMPDLRVSESPSNPFVSTAPMYKAIT